MFEGMFLYFTILILLFVIYYVFTMFYKRFENVDTNKVRRTYYIVLIIWYYFFNMSFFNEIMKLNSTPLLGIPQQYWNFIILGVTFVIGSIFVEWMFIIPKSIKELAFGGLKITAEERKNIEDVSKIYEDTIEIFKEMYSMEHKIICNMRNHILNFDNNPDTMYIDLLNEYQHQRKHIGINCYEHNESGLGNVKKYLGINKSKFERILKGITKNKYFILGNSKNEILITVIDTSFFKRIIVIISGNIIPSEEYNVIGNIVSCFDLTLDNMIKEDIINSFSDSSGFK